MRITHADPKLTTTPLPIDRRDRSDPARSANPIDKPRNRPCG